MVDRYWIVEVYLPFYGEWMPSPPLRSRIDLEAQLAKWANHQIKVSMVKKIIKEVNPESLWNTSTVSEQKSTAQRS